MKASRTKRTIQNSRMSLLLFVIQILVGFYSRKIFLDYLGAEVLGLNTTLGNILQFLNLAELGIGLAMATSIYKPLHDDDHETICEILSVEGYLYRRIALLLCALSVPVLALLPVLFPNTECGLAYVYVSYVVFLSGSVFSYLWNYREVLIQADQKGFKLMPWIHGIRYSKMFVQIALLLWSERWGLWGWITVEFLGNVALVFVINHVVRKEYPWLRQPATAVGQLLVKYKGLLVKTRQLFVHKIGQFVLEQTAPLIIYAYVSLTMVTYYGNYMMLIGYTVTLMNVLFEGMGASIGNLIADGDKRHTMEVFWELFTSRLWLAGVACFALYSAVGPFITVWLGAQYVLGHTTLLLLVLGMFIRMTRSVVDSFKNAFQLFADVWSPVAEASINLGGSILFGYFWGLDGILLGSNLSLVAIVLLWKPYYTFREGFHAPSAVYYAQYALHVAVLLGVAVAVSWLLAPLLQGHDGLLLQGAAIAAAIVLYAVLAYALFMLLTKGMRQFTQRIHRILTHQI